MFYANNEQVKGIFLNGRNYNCLAYGFGKIIPEDRNAEQLNLNLAYKYLNQYRIEWGTVKDGYENALVIPRFDKPDSNGVFHTPFTYYYGGNIISTKQVPVLITDGNYALSNALVYNDMNINGAINYFATNTDFQGHNVNVYPEDSYQSSPLLHFEMLNNCGNFDLNINTRFSKTSYPTLYNCNNFSGNFKYVGNGDHKYPGFRGFLYECKDGIFNIDCTNMHGGGSAANVTNYYNFFGIQGCNNIKLNITGSSWQVWPHDHSFSRNCNINTYNVISGFGYMNDCNFDIVLPKDSKPEMDKSFEFLNNAENCNYNLNALDSNLFNYRSGVGHTAFFEDLNNCNLNLQVNNTVSFDYSFGSNFNNCNIVFDNIKASLGTFAGWSNLRNCNISGNVVASNTEQGVIEDGDGLSINLNVAKSSWVSPMWRCHNVKGSLVCGNMTYIYYSSYLNLNVYEGRLIPINVEHSRFNSNGTTILSFNLNNCMFEIHNSNNFEAHGASSCNFNMRNSVGTAILTNLNNVDFVERGGANYNIASINNCYNSWIYANSMYGTIENVYNTRIDLKNNNPNFVTQNVGDCEIAGFPTSAYYTTNCTFRASIPNAAFRNSSYITWNNVWPHAVPRGGDGFHTWYMTRAGLNSVGGLVGCYLNCTNGSLVAGDISSSTGNLQTSLENYYNNVEFITSNENSRLIVSCNSLRLGLQPVPMPTPIPFVVAGFVDSCISANSIYTTGVFGNGVANVGTNTRIYCSGRCDTPFYSRLKYNSPKQLIVLLNDYHIMNKDACTLSGGLYRFGTLSNAPYLSIGKGACVFINNTVLSDITVDNALLFMGSNASVVGSVNVTNGGRVRNAANLTADDIRFIDRGQLCWNLWDYGPWGSRRLIDFCTSV